MRVDRLVSIIMVLLERRRTTIPELAELCEVSTRTISRDLEAINQAGIPVVTYPGAGGGVGIMENYKLEKRLFTTSDVVTLLMGLGCIRTSLSGGEVANVIAKVNGFIPEEQRREIELQAGRIAIDMTPWVDRGGSMDAFELAQQAMDENRLLQFGYRDRMGERSKRTVEPYRLLLKGMRWYLDAYCCERADFRLFKLARMTDIVLSGETFEPRDYRPAQTVQPAFRDEGVEHVEVLVREEARESFLDFFGETCAGDTCEGGFRAVVAVPPGPRGYRTLLRFGTDCICLGPAAFRAGFASYLRELGALYRDGA